MSEATKSYLTRYLEELIESVSQNERRKNNRLKGKTKKIVDLINYLKVISQKEKN